MTETTDSNDKVVKALRDSVKEVKRLKKENRRLTESSREPVAVVGMGCRFPGGVRTPEDLWKLVDGATDAVGDFPTDRGWDLDGIFDDDPDTPGTTYARQAGFLYDAGEFDAAFFGISPKEATAMDPQQRLLLETAWEAVERGRLDPDSLRGSDTGVYVGITAPDYGPRASHAEDGLEGHLATGTATSVAAGRISYTLGLEGPAMSVDTACSSSLVALHSAVTALRREECTLALAGGATVFSDPGAFLSFSRQRALSPGSRAKAFDASADGTAWCEGAGMILLARLSDAERLGLPVLAVVRGTAVNQDGASSGLTAPNGLAQRRLLRSALADAGLAGADVDAVEAHGTGTPLGDPIEARALMDVYGRGRPADRPLLLGSLKSNIGHSVAAAGVGGLIKSVMALNHDRVPPTLHLNEPTREVDWSPGTVLPVAEHTPWPEVDRPRVAGVSSFGMSGTNAHALLEQPPSAPAEGSGTAERSGHTGPVLWPLSAHTPDALSAQARRLLDHLEAHPGLDPAAVGHTLATARAGLDHRAVAVSADDTERREALAALARGEDHDALVRGRAGNGHRVAFVFPGQGGQWPGMVRGLLEDSPRFAAHIDECEKALTPYVDWSLTEVIRGGPDAPDTGRIDVVQPALFAVMVSLAKLWADHGLTPSAVVGHSQGEIAAAHVAGALTLDEATRIVVRRGRLFGRMSGSGGMVALSLPVTRVEEMLERWEGRIEVAVVNGPNAVVAAGDADAVTELVAVCEKESIHHRRIDVDVASHCHHIVPFEDDILNSLRGIEPTTAETGFYSTVTGEAFDTAGLDPAYWYRNLRGRVRLEEAVRSMSEDGYTAFVEVGPHPVLSYGVAQTLEDTGIEGTAVLSTLHRDHGGTDGFATSLARAHAHGLPLDWDTVHPGAHTVDLPTYAFEHRTFWLAPTGGGRALSAEGIDEAGHPLLGARTQLPGAGGEVLTGRIGPDTHPWLTDHGVSGTVLLPGAAFWEMVQHAAAPGESVADLTLHTPLPLPGRTRVQITLSPPEPSGNRTVRVHSRPEEAPDAAWTEHATGLLVPAEAPAPRALTSWPPEGEAVDLDGLYAGLAELGYEYGPAFQGLHGAWRDGDTVYSEVALPEALRGDAAGYGLHPALLDAALHTVSLTTDAGVRLPFAWTDVTLYAEGATDLRVRVRSLDEDEYTLDLFDPAGQPVASIASLAVRPLPERIDLGAPDDLYSLAWNPVQPRITGLPNLTVIGDDRLGLRAHLDAVHEPDPRAPLPAGTTAVLGLGGDGGADPENARRTTRDLLALLQGWADDDTREDTPLVVLTRRAVPVLPGEDVTDLEHASLWGLVRAAQTERPGRFVLVDLDDTASGAPHLAAALATGEEQLALRGGTPHVPRLVRAETAAPEESEGEGPTDLSGGTVVVTGATGTLGSEVTRHLVRNHGARDLLLLSRSGPDGPAAQELSSALEGLGARADFAACDASDPDALRIALARAESPVVGVVHLAGTLDDGALASLTPDHVDRVMAPKTDAALHLHRLTLDQPVKAFVLFSSASNVLGSPGQANYAAANAVLDALAHHRRAHGLPATSLAWGLWAERGGMSAHLDAADLARLSRIGMARLLGTDEGLRLMDHALDLPAPYFMPMPVDTAGLRSRAERSGTVPPVYRALVPPPRRRAAKAAEFDVAALPPEQRADALLDLVRSGTADVLGLPGPADVPADRDFLELGLDSLTAVQLRGDLREATGVRLASGAVFTHRTPEALARHLDSELPSGNGGAPAPAAPEPAGAEAGLDGVVALFRDACVRGRIDDGITLIRAAAAFRPAFTGPEDYGTPPRPVEVATGPARPRLICLPSLVMVSGVQEYARFGGALKGERDTTVLPQPGFAPGEPLPATREAAVDLQTRAVLDLAGDDPFVLVSRSSGGWMAHAVAERLQRGEHAPEAVVLMDTPTPQDRTTMPVIESGVVERERRFGLMDPARVTAMGRYLELFADWTPGELTMPLLLVRPEEQVRDGDGNPVGGPDWRFDWPREHVPVDVPGDHISMLEEHGPTTAEAVHTWLAQNL
ncbi:SDR family NAD(P)-dependent oxidoreductase [Nocardiopsis sp. HNM0947]|uniref:SDR family NAD(P)-dependent oxidoreductase n=1 Tax=Nocardiopsis coralli TaxID=2772213 RepID=A0ABR9PAC6_9ACTN|nr:type I polyketide synthase [Nocardiopsis coralli]MBE3000796.1 SDR family NAD(P)-dependent oxidoreductase [Nocardiopsis coralli]